MMKNLFKIKILSFVFVMFIFCLSFFYGNKVYASDSYDVVECKYNDEYITWSKLSDEEKAVTQRPIMCDFDATEDNRLQSNVRKSFHVFNKLKYPAVYDKRGTNLEANVKDQMSTGQCWAFSATTALEIFTKVSLEQDWVYSPRHIEYATSRTFLNDEVNLWGFNREVGSGGNVFHSSAYLTSQVGPILEEDMPFEDNEELIELSAIRNKEVKVDVNDVVLSGTDEFSPCTSEVINEIKDRIMTTGSVSSTAYFTGLSNYYNSRTHALYYNGDEYSNHAITIVGWDDNYSRTNFSSSNMPSSNGAWIVQNSWGEDFGDNGYNYISYNDERICTIFMAINDIDEEVEDNAYIYDKLGHNIAVGYRSGDLYYKYGYGLAVYEKSNNAEILKEVTIGSLGYGSYEIYYAPGDASTTSVSDMTLVGTGTTSYNGYKTHKFDNPLYIGSDVNKFSIVVYWILDNNYNPIPVCNTNSSDYFYLVANTNQTYFSRIGSGWEDAANYGYIVSIKAFTDNINYSLVAEVDTVSKGADGFVAVNMSLNANNIVKDNISLSVFDSNDNKITSYNTNYKTDTSEHLMGLDVIFSSVLDNGNYYINVYYGNVLMSTIDFVVLFGISSTLYKVSNVDMTIYLSSPTQLSTFLSNLTGYTGDVTKEGNVVESGYVGTGMMLDGYVVVLKGDVTGDGLIKVNDVMKISKYTVEGTGLEEEYYKSAADVTGDGLVKVNDVMKISKYTVEGGTL